jgi:glycerol transport system permease protein
MGVLMIAILLRFMDSFMIYTEPFVVTGGGPGQFDQLLSIDLVKHGPRPVRSGSGGSVAYSIMYFLVIFTVISCRCSKPCDDLISTRGMA